MNLKTMVRWSMLILVVAIGLSGFASETSAADVRSAPTLDPAGVMCPAPSVELDPAVSNLQRAEASGKHSPGAELRDEVDNTQYRLGMTEGISE